MTEAPDGYNLVDAYDFTLGYDEDNNKIICGLYTITLYIPSGVILPGLNETNGEYTISYNGVNASLKIEGLGNPPAVTLNTNDDGNETLYIYNSTSFDMPLTGAMGIEDYITIGVIIILVGAVGKIHKNKKFASLRESIYDARRIIENYDKMSRAETKNIKKISKMQKRCRKMQKKTEKMLKK